MRAWEEETDFAELVRADPVIAGRVDLARGQAERADRVHVIGFDVDGNRVEFDATGWFARCMQHEYDHLNGTLYIDRLDDRQSKKARKAVKRNGWGKPGNAWHPGVDRDPFGHDEDEIDEHADELIG